MTRGPSSGSTWSPWPVLPCKQAVLALPAGMDAFVSCHLTPQLVAPRSLQGGPHCMGGWKALVVAGGVLAQGYQLASLLAHCSQHGVRLCRLHSPPWGPS